MEHHKRTMAKTISWRIVGFLITTGVLYLFNRDAKQSLIIMGSADVVKIFVYYAHERVWNRVKFGRAKPPEYQI